MVISGLLVTAQVLLDDAEPGQRLGLTDGVADLTAQGQGSLNVTESPVIVPDAPLYAAEPGQGQGLTPAIAVLAGKRQGLALMDGGLLIVPAAPLDDGEVAQRRCFACLVADLAEQGHGLLQVAGGLCVAALHQENVAKIGQHHSFAGAVCVEPASAQGAGVNADCLGSAACALEVGKNRGDEAGGMSGPAVFGHQCGSREQVGKFGL